MWCEADLMQRRRVAVGSHNKTILTMAKITVSSFGYLDSERQYDRIEGKYFKRVLHV